MWIYVCVGGGSDDIVWHRISFGYDEFNYYKDWFLLGTMYDMNKGGIAMGLLY